MTRYPILTAALLASCIAAPAWAQGDSAGGGGNRAVAPPSGEQVYREVCAACHMADAKGATGAATIPALAGNAKLSVAAYPITIVTKGKGAMPSMRPYLTPDQIAGVIGYVRTHFGNSYAAPVTAADVTRIAGPKAGG
jgi:mono/diheme cytochrome c family protein